MSNLLTEILSREKQCVRDVASRVETLTIAIVFTSIEPTLAALRKAADLAVGLNARIQIIVPQIVPFPLQLHEAPVRREFQERRFRTLAEEQAVSTSVNICLCRDRFEMLSQRLPAGSPVFIGLRKSWFPNRDKSLAKALRKAGHRVVTVEVED